jgi:hypothetical protein
VLQNIRRWWENAFLADYEALHEAAVADYQRGRYPARHGGYEEIDIGHELRARPDIGDVRVSDFMWSHQMSSEEFADFSLSSSITQRAISNRLSRSAFPARGRLKARDVSAICATPLTEKVTATNLSSLVNSSTWILASGGETRTVFMRRSQ